MGAICSRSPYSSVHRVFGRPQATARTQRTQKSLLSLLSLGSSRKTRRGSVFICVPRSISVYGQHHRDLRPMRLAIAQLDLAAEVAGEAAHEREAEAGALLAGAEERADTAR